MVSWEYPPKIVGGLARHVQELSEALAEQGHTVHVLTGPYSEGPEETVTNGVHIHRANLGYPDPRGFFVSVLNLNFGLLEQAIKLLRHGYTFDLVHCHDWLGAYAAKVLKHALDLPLVATIHATEYGRHGGLHNDLQRQISDSEWWLTYESYRVICCSRHMYNELRSFFQLPADKLTVIPNGVNPARFEVAPGVDLQQFRRRYAADHEKLVFFIGRMVREKGAADLLRAVPKIRHYWRDVKFVLAGSGPFLDELRRLAHHLQIDEAVTFTGFISDEERNSFYAVADLAVYPSLYEPFGIVALEAMATKTPVVVADTGGFGEIVIHGVNGLKAYPGNANSLADNILTLLYRPDLAVELAQEAYAEVQTKYNWQAIAQQTAEVYAQVVTGKSRVEPWYQHEVPGRYEYTVAKGGVK